MKTKKNSWFGESDVDEVGHLLRNARAQVRKGGPCGATEASDDFEH